MSTEQLMGGGEPIAYAPPDNTQNEWLKAYLAMDPTAVRRAALWLGAWRAAGLYVDPRNTDRARIRFAWTADLDDGEARNVRELPANGPGFYRGYGHLHAANIGRRLRLLSKWDRHWQDPEAEHDIMLSNAVVLSFDSHETPSVRSVLAIPTQTWDAVRDWLALMDFPHPIYRDLHRELTEAEFAALRLDEVARAYLTPYGAV